MKNTTKVTLGIGLASFIASVVVSNKLMNKLHSASNRHKIKKIVAEDFDKNKKLLRVVDQLSQDELGALVSVMKKVEENNSDI